MRNSIVFLCLLFLCTAAALAKDSASQSKTRLKGFLTAIVAIEREAKPIEPMHIPIAKRTRAEDKEITRRIEFLDNLSSGKVNALGKEIRNYQSQCDDSLLLQHQAVRDAQEALATWVGAKLTLQNAGVNNPSLDAIRKAEPTTYQEYQAKLKAAQDQVK